MATLRNHAARIGLGLAGLFLAVHPAMAQPTDPNSAETLANRLGQGARLGQEGRQSGRAGSRRESHRHHGNYEERQKINTVT